jgi:hypothetical protein
VDGRGEVERFRDSGRVGGMPGAGVGPAAGGCSESGQGLGGARIGGQPVDGFGGDDGKEALAQGVHGRGDGGGGVGGGDEGGGA